MAGNLKKEQIEELDKRRKRRLLLKRTFMVAAVAVVFLTVYGLVLPAVTMEHPDPACGLEEHVHTSQCMERQLTCPLPETGAHVHTQACYDDEGQLTCDKPSAGHMHVASCFAKGGELICENTSADHGHDSSCYAQEGDLLCDQEEVAHMHRATCFDENGELVCQSEAAHVHGPTCYEAQTPVTGEEASEGADAATDGASEAVADQPEGASDANDGEGTAPVDAVSADGGAQDAVASAAEDYRLTCEEESAGHVHFALCYDLSGQLICGQEEAVTVDHAHGEECYGEVAVCGLQEHSHDEVCFDSESYQMIQASKEHSAQLAEQEAQEAAKEQQSPTPEAVADAELEALKAQGLAYENDRMVVVFELPEDEQRDVRFQVTEAASPGDEEAAVDAVADNDATAQAEVPEGEPATAGDELQPVWEDGMHIEATVDGQPVEAIADLGATAQIRLKKEAVQPILEEIDYSQVADELKQEVGAEITVTQTPENAEEFAISERPKAQTETFVVTDAENGVFTMALAHGDVRTVAAGTPNPTFSVSYYADLEMVTAQNASYGASADQLVVVNTEGARLPTNATKGQNLKYVKLAGNDAGGYSVATETRETQIYSTDSGLQYIKAPNLNYFNKLYENYHYELAEIYTGTPGGSSWTKVFPAEGRTKLEDVHFTNRSDTALASDRYILISDGMEIKLKFKTTSSGFSAPVTFYDYDITDGHVYGTAANAQSGASPLDNNLLLTSTRELFVNTNRQGINAAANYSGSGAEYGFGNITGGTGLNEQKDAGGYYLNKANTASGKSDKAVIEKCYFGLVTGISFSGNASLLENYDADTVQFSPGIKGPAVFGDAETAGKTKVDGSYSLGFSREGDSYEMTSVAKGGGAVLSNLEVLKDKITAYNTTATVLTNHFWPLDIPNSVATFGADAQFGKLRGSSTNLKYQRIEQGVSDRWSWFAFNAADNGQNHNNYFGMVSQVDFSLDADYVGPLEYLFLGDDDMWVFLLKVDDDGNVVRSGAEGPRLVCDIGGVHQTTGSFVNLRDYLPNGSEGHYALRFYYTERGATGSTCYMRFTLPSVSNSTVEQDTGTIQVEKTVVAQDGSSSAYSDEFEFTVDLKGPDGQPLPDDYSYARYGADGSVTNGLIIHTGGTFHLKHGERVVIKYLPVGTTYTIQEVRNSSVVSLENGGYRPSFEYLVNGEVRQSAIEGQFTGVIEKNDNAVTRKVVFTNTVPYQMPATGGMGTQAFLLAGAALLLVAGGIKLRHMYKAQVLR